MLCDSIKTNTPHLSRPDIADNASHYNLSVGCDIGRKNYYPIEAITCAVMWHYEAYAAMHAYATDCTQRGTLRMGKHALLTDFAFRQ